MMRLVTLPIPADLNVDPALCSAIRCRAILLRTVRSALILRVRLSRISLTDEKRQGASDGIGVLPFENEDVAAAATPHPTSAPAHSGTSGRSPACHTGLDSDHGQGSRS
jgi:hypothetical protein